MSDSYIAVVGAINIDIWGRSTASLIMRDSNPGTISYSFGGVGRNIAHNISLLGCPVSMLTALGGDHWTERIERSCAGIGIDLSHALRAPEYRTGTYLAVSGPDGDMELGLSDMEIAGAISPGYIARELQFLNAAALVVIDGNLREDTISYICENVSAPIFCDPVSVTKAKKILPSIGRIHTLKPNSLEAQLLTGFAEPEESAAELVRMGAVRAFVSDGPRGIVVAEGDRVERVSCVKTELVNATGGGDAVMAALCESFFRGLDSLTAARRAVCAGAIAVESAETISPLMSAEAVEKRM